MQKSATSYFPDKMLKIRIFTSFFFAEINDSGLYFVAKLFLQFGKIFLQKNLFKIPWKNVLYFILLKKAYVLVIPHTFMYIKNI